METSLKLELGGPVGGAPTPSHSVTYPKGREDFLSPTGECFLLDSSRKKEGLLLPWQPLSQWKTVTARPVKAPPSRQVPPGLCSSLSQLSLSSDKERLSPVFSGLARRGPLDHVSDCDSLLVPNKPILLEYYLAICLRSTTMLK